MPARPRRSDVERGEPGELVFVADRSNNAPMTANAATANAAQAAPPHRRGRPPKRVPSYGETREALIRAGVAALSEKGFSATGLDEILRSVGVPKGSFYHYFPS